MVLSVIYSDTFLGHDTGYFHPERPERLIAIRQAIQIAPWAAQIIWQEPTAVDVRSPLSHIHKIHDACYVENLMQLAMTGGGLIDQDTPVSTQSYEVALLAVNAWLDGVDQVIAVGAPCFVLARPPGHHAGSRVGMGFCLLNNAAIAAHYALAQPNINRVAILDWDVHHGNGTQAIVETNPQIAFCSLHESPQYPGTGSATETGRFNNVLNLPLAAGSTIADYQPLFEQHVMPFLSHFQPDLLIVSAGYDANEADPLAGLALQPPDYGVLTDYCLQLTPRVVLGLEGGYDLTALAESVVVTIDRCLRSSCATLG